MGLQRWPELTSAFRGASGLYHADLIIGDPFITNPLTWRIADFKLKYRLPPRAYDARDTVSYYQYLLRAAGSQRRTKRSRSLCWRLSRRSNTYSARRTSARPTSSPSPSRASSSARGSST
jgi:hypothetical protein